MCNSHIMSGKCSFATSIHCLWFLWFFCSLSLSLRGTLGSGCYRCSIYSEGMRRIRDGGLLSCIEFLVNFTVVFLDACYEQRVFQSSQTTPEGSCCYFLRCPCPKLTTLKSEKLRLSLKGSTWTSLDCPNME